MTVRQRIKRRPVRLTVYATDCVGYPWYEMLIVWSKPKCRK